MGYDMGEGGEGGAAAPGGQPSTGGAPGGPFAEYGGIDPNLDPELAMAIRISLEEAKYKDNQDGDNKPADAQTSAPAANAEPAGQPRVDSQMENAEPQDEQQDMDDDEEEDYDEELKAAMLLSMQGHQPEEGENVENKADNNVDDIADVIDEDFIGEIMEDLGVDMTEDAVKNILNPDKKKEDKKKDEDKKE